MFCGAIWLEIFIHQLCLWDKKSQQQRLTIIQIYGFYWIIFQNKTSPFNSCRSCCRNVHRSDGGHGERVSGGLVCVDTERESTLMSQTTVAYACSRKNKIQISKKLMSVWTMNSYFCRLPLASGACRSWLLACGFCFCRPWVQVCRHRCILLVNSIPFGASHCGQRSPDTFPSLALAPIDRSPTCF